MPSPQDTSRGRRQEPIILVHSRRKATISCSRYPISSSKETDGRVIEEEVNSSTSTKHLPFLRLQPLQPPLMSLLPLLLSLLLPLLLLRRVLLLMLLRNLVSAPLWFIVPLPLLDLRADLPSPQRGDYGVLRPRKPWQDISPSQ
jgi:hypothetical protein